MSVLVDDNNPRNGTYKQPTDYTCTWDTTTNQFVPTTSFSTIFMFPPLPPIHCIQLHTQTCKAQKYSEVSSYTYVKDHSFQL